MGLSSMLPVIIPTAAAVVGGKLMKNFRHTVPEGHVAVKRRFGKIVRKCGQPKIYCGGYVWTIPGVHCLDIYHQSTNPLEITCQVLELKSGVYYASGMVVFGVTDMAKVALANTDNVREVIRKYAEPVVVSVLSGRSWRKVDGLKPKLIDELTAKVSGYGVAITDFMVAVQPTPMTQAALAVSTRARSLRKGLEILGVDYTELDPGILTAALAAQPVAQLLAPSGGETPDTAADEARIIALVPGAGTS